MGRLRGQWFCCTSKRLKMQLRYLLVSRFQKQHTSLLFMPVGRRLFCNLSIYQYRHHHYRVHEIFCINGLPTLLTRFGHLGPCMKIVHEKLDINRHHHHNSQHRPSRVMDQMYIQKDRIDESQYTSENSHNATERLNFLLQSVVLLG